MAVEPVALDLTQRFKRNMNRCSDLLLASHPIGLSISTLLPNTDTFRSVAQDILRSVVVLLHASLEDLLRTVLGEYYRRNPHKVLEKYEGSARKGSKVWNKIAETDSTITIGEFLEPIIMEILNVITFSDTKSLSEK